MKLPRWLLIGMLTSSAVLPLVAVGWWWVTWPNRTARELIEYMAANRQDRIDRMMGWPDPKSLAFHILTFDDPPPRAWSDIEPQSRSLSDLVLGRRRFRFAKIGGYGFLVERGRLTTFLSDSNAGAIRLYLQGRS